MRFDMSTSCGPITIIADDLTGACDAAVPFAAAGEVVRVGLGDRLPVGSGSVRAMSTNTRDVPACEAAERIRDLADELGADAESFKKIDSVFRGNTVVEIRAAVRHWGFDLALVAPAYPALGRSVREGVLRIEDAAGEREVRIEEQLAEAGCSLSRIAAGSTEDVAVAMRAALAEGVRILLCDAAVQDDLEQVVHAARSLRKRILWIGSGGLAHALAANASSGGQDAERRRGQVVYFVGSPHAVTSAQVERLKNVKNAEYACVSVVSIEMGRTAGDEVRRAIAGVRAEQIGCVLMTGGDTALFVCRALEVESLRLEREFAVGVPLGRVEGGPLDGVTVALKSGGFGDVDLMGRLLEEFGVKHEVTV
jgi:uncharacterized protein YgbK (DUF1537 family)